MTGKIESGMYVPENIRKEEIENLIGYENIELIWKELNDALNDKLEISPKRLMRIILKKCFKISEEKAWDIVEIFESVYNIS